MHLLSRCCNYSSTKLLLNTISTIQQQQQSCRRHIAYIPFPICTSGDKSPNTIYCSSLGDDWQHPFALQLQHHCCVARGFQFTRFQYRHAAHPTHVWCVDSWIEDILLLIDRFYDMRGPVNLIACGTGASAALRASILRPTKLNALVLISPAVGVDLDYFNRLAPNAVQLMRNGETAVLPSSTNGPSTQLTYRSALAYKNDCAVNRRSLQSIALHCPIGIIHGLDDNIVPYENSIDLLRKLDSRHVVLELIKHQRHHFTAATPQLLNMIDDVLLNAACVDSKMVQNVFKPANNFDSRIINNNSFTGDACEIVTF